MQIIKFPLPANVISTGVPASGKGLVGAAPSLPGSGGGPGGPSGPSGPASRMMAVGGLPGLIGTQPFGAGQASG